MKINFKKKMIMLEVSQLFQNYSKGKLLQVVWYWHEERQRDQWNRAERSEIKLHLWSNDVPQGGQDSSTGDK